MELKQTVTLTKKHEFALAVRDMLENRLHNLIDLAQRHGFTIKVGGRRSVRQIITKSNVSFLNPDIP
jgi:hypothetical protein